MDGHQEKAVALLKENIYISSGSNEVKTLPQESK